VESENSIYCWTDKTHRARIRDLEDQADKEQTLNLHHFRGGEMLRLKELTFHLTTRFKISIAVHS